MPVFCFSARPQPAPAARARRWLAAWGLLLLTLARGAAGQALPPPGTPGPVRGPDGPVTLLLALPGGGVLVGGPFGRYDGRPCPGLVRLLPGGGRDPDFAPDLGRNGRPTALALQADGKLLVGARYEAPPDTSCAGCAGRGRRLGSTYQLLRLLPSGAPDPAFRPAVAAYRSTRQPDEVGDVFALPDGRVLVVGRFGGLPYHALRVVRLEADGRRDPGFAAYFDHLLPLEKGTVRPLPGGGLLAGHCCARMVERLGPDGAHDPTFVLDPRWNGIPAVVAALPGGRVLVGAGESPTYVPPGLRSTSLVRLLPGGRLDTTFLPPAGALNTGTTLLAVLADGRLLAGDCLVCGGDGLHPAAYPPDGPRPQDRAEARTLQARAAAWAARHRWLQRLGPDGAPDRGFAPGQAPPNGDLRALAVLADGRLVAGGNFTRYAGRPAPHLVFLRPDGTPDPAWPPPPSR